MKKKDLPMPNRGNSFESGEDAASFSRSSSSNIDRNTFRTMNPSNERNVNGTRQTTNPQTNPESMTHLREESQEQQTKPRFFRSNTTSTYSSRKTSNKISNPGGVFKYFRNRSSSSSSNNTLRDYKSQSTTSFEEKGRDGQMPRQVLHEDSLDIPLFSNNPFLGDNGIDNPYSYHLPKNSMTDSENGHSITPPSITERLRANPFVNYSVVGKKKPNEINAEWSFERRSWTRLRVQKEDKNIPNCRSGHACVQIGHYMYIIGGYSDGCCFSDVYVLNLKSHQWRHIENSGSDVSGVSGRASHCCCVGVGNRDIYMFGGSGPSWGRTNLDDLCKFDTENETWEVVNVTGQLPPPGYGQSLCRYQKKLILFGGTCGSYFYNHLFEFNIETGVWTRLQATGKAPKPRYKHQAVILGDSMYVLGGGQYTPDDGPMDIYRLDLINLCWHQESLGASSQQARIAHTCVVDEINNQILIFGGRSASEAKLQDLYAWQVTREGEQSRSETNRGQFSEKGNNNGVDGCGITSSHDTSGSDNNERNLVSVRIDNDGNVVNHPTGGIYNFNDLPSSQDTNTNSNSYTNVHIDNSLPGVVLSVTPSGVLRDLFPEQELQSSQKDPHQSKGPHGREFHCACFYDGQMFIFGGSTGVKRMNDTWCFKLDLTPPSLAILCAHSLLKHYDHDTVKQCLKEVLPDTLLESLTNLRPNVTDFQSSLMN